VLRITGGRGVDYVIEVGGAQTIVKSLKSTRNGGIVSAIGLLSEGVPADVMPLIVLGAKTGECAIFAVVKMPCVVVLLWMVADICTVRGSMSASREMLEELVKVVEEYDIHPYISKTFEFDQALEAFETLRKQTDVGKIVVKGA
jgi:NADPH:quinone reductase-like Zn-dependent oxidoreductase